MCGIVGYTGYQAAGAVILDGLRRVEYRGYDSAGLALAGADGDFYVARSAGKLDTLVQRLEGALPDSHSGIGHTRWATHGEPSDRNAHPHLDPDGLVAVVHNGVVENHDALRAQFARGDFASDTDTEVLAHMLAACLERGQDLLDAMRDTVALTEGAFSVVAVARDQPGRLVAARAGNAGGIVIGCGNHEHVVASDVGAVLPVARRVVFLEPGEVADVRPDAVTYVDAAGWALEKSVQVLPYDPVAAARGPYRHFMLKEIFEQPAALADALRGRYHASPARTTFDDLPLDAARVRSLRRVVLIGMGTSMHAAMIGRHYIERFARLPAEVDNAAEFRYRAPLLGRDTLVISVTQSGETVDTLAAMDEARRRGAPQITLCNTPGAQTTRIADGTILLRAGPEVAVASTKTFLASLLMLHGLALTLGRLRGTLDPALEERQVREALAMPGRVQAALESAAEVERVAQRYAQYEDCFVLGRGLGYPLALEGALKLKEIAYVHAEGYGAAEMKHGPIALIDERIATVALAPRDGLRDKMLSNIEQVRSRRGRVLALVTQSDHSCDTLANDVLEIPEVDPFLVPIVAAVPLQLLSYHVAAIRGADVDQPRNLAKTVTVE